MSRIYDYFMASRNNLKFVYGESVFLHLCTKRRTVYFSLPFFQQQKKDERNLKWKTNCLKLSRQNRNMGEENDNIRTHSHSGIM